MNMLNKKRRLLKKGQEGMTVQRLSPYDVNLYLEIDPEKRVEPPSGSQFWVSGLTPEERMDQTTQSLMKQVNPYSIKLTNSTYKPTQEQSNLKMIPYNDPAGEIMTTAMTIPMGGPVAKGVTTAVKTLGPAMKTLRFWTQTAGDVLGWMAADQVSKDITGKTIGGNINTHILGLEEEHPVGELAAGFGVGAATHKFGNLIYDTAKDLSKKYIIPALKNSKEYLPLDYVERQIIPLAKRYGNWQGATSSITNPEVYINDKLAAEGAFAGPNSYAFPREEMAKQVKVHEMRHGLDYSSKEGSTSTKNWLNRIFRKPISSKNSTGRAIQLNNDQINILNEAYPSGFMDKLLSKHHALLSEKIADNAQFRSIFDDYFFEKFGRYANEAELSNFITQLPKEEFVNTLISRAKSNDLWEFMTRSAKGVPRSPNFTEVTTPKGRTIKINNIYYNLPSIDKMKTAISSIPAFIGLYFGTQNTDQ